MVISGLPSRPKKNHKKFVKIVFSCGKEKKNEKN
jgi:hypothetical protein